MEKQKIFWVILSVSVFVVVVLVVGVFLLKKPPSALAVEPANTIHTFSESGSSPYEFGREPSPEASKGSEVLNLVIGGEGQQGTTAGQQGAAATSTPSTSVATSAPKAAEPATGVTPPEPKPQPTAAQPVKPKAAPTVAAKPTPAAPTTQYWIQTGSYRSLSRAEDLAQGLTAKGLAGRIFSYNSGADTFYRVRLGPYANMKEAQEFLSRVKQIQGLESSYISQVGRGSGAN